MSRAEMPKQALTLVGERSMFQHSVDRLLPLFPIERILVVTRVEYRQLLMEQMPGLPEQNFILEPERLYMVQAIRFVKEALVATGSGWMDAEPEIAKIYPDIYAVNEDGDKPEKRAFCQEHNLGYVVLKRTPKEGLATRTSTNLRGF